jgi:hypothetical protein
VRGAGFLAGASLAWRTIEKIARVTDRRYS